jgi:nicotinamide-nucleotide amidase
MAQELEKEGFQVIRKTTVGDVEKNIQEALDTAISQAQIILLTGGIGPTKDDITQKTLCNYFNCHTYFSEEVYQNIHTLFSASGKEINPLTRRQAIVPDKCTIIQNKVGTAPCTWFEENRKILISMPGVPHEMKWLMTHEIIPRLKKQFRQNLFIHHKTTWISGFTESMLATQLAPFEKQLPPHIKLAYLPQPGLIRLRLSVYTNEETTAIQTITEQNEKLHQILNGHILAKEDKPLEEQIGETLLARKLTIGTAESCTGGRIAAMLTSIPGSSRYFTGSIISYNNNIKHHLLGVSPSDLSHYGAVSRQVVEQMARGAIHALGCTCAVSTSGIAGPSGGTPQKPVGTTWIAVAHHNNIISRCHHFTSTRETNQAHAANTALLMLLELIRKA